LDRLKYIKRKRNDIARKEKKPKFPLGVFIRFYYVSSLFWPSSKDFSMIEEFDSEL
jgi:hypothetical protein